MANMKKQNFLQGAAVLTISMIVVKIVGAIFKLPLGNILMENGMAYFNASYNLFTAIYALTVTGLTTAVARMVAACATKRRYRDCVHILLIARKIFIGLGLAGTLVMLLGSNLFASMAKLDSSIYAIMVMSPAIFFSCMMATYRGYYEGMRNMVPSAVSEVVEVVAKMLTGLLFTFITLMIGQNMAKTTGTIFGVALAGGMNATEAEVQSVLLPFMAAGAMLGVTVSTAFGFLYMRRAYKKSGSGFTREELAASPKPVSDKAVVWRLVKTALPITISAVVTNITSLIDLFTIVDRLQYAINLNPEYFAKTYGAYVGTKTEELSSYIYGGYTMSSPIFNLVPAFTALFGKSALPNITEAWVGKDMRGLKHNVSSMVRMTSLISFPAGIGLVVMGQQVASLLYSRVDGAMLSVGVPLQFSGLAAIFLALIAPLYAVLQALGRFDLPVKFTLIGAGLKIITNFILVGIPEINISGAAIGTTFCNAVILILCLVSIGRITSLTFNFKRIFGKNIAAALVCGGVAFLVSRIGDGKMITILAIVLAMGAYVVSLFLFRALSEEDVLMMPKGARIAAKLKKYHLIEVSRRGDE